MGLERCTKCTLPITWETLYFDDDGVCNICRNWEIKDTQVDWDQREQDFQKILMDIKDRKCDYDCLIPFSGGKDSTYTLWAAVKKYNLRCLVVSYDHWFYRPQTIENRKRTFEKLGVDVITFTPNFRVVKKLMFESLRRKGDFCWHCHAGVFSYPMHIAMRFKIPLILWGEGGGEYEAYFKYADIEETDEWKFNRRIILGMRAEDMAGFIDEDIRDLTPYIYPSKDELERASVTSLPLGKFEQWDVQDHVRIIKSELGWKEDVVESAYPGLTYEKVECMFTGVRDYIKYLKRGFSRMTHLTSMDIKYGRMTRDEAMEYIRKYEGKRPASLDVFLNVLGISEDEFNSIVALHLIPPAEKIDPGTLPHGEKLWDQDEWFFSKNKGE